MAETTTTTTNETTVVDPQVIDTQAEIKQPEDNSVIRTLRQELSKTKQELEAIRKAEEDKTKSIEDKLAEATAKAQALEADKQNQARQYQLEKELMKNKVNPEFLDLMLSKSGTAEDLSQVVDELLTTYPSAFIKEDEKPQPIGKTGVSVTSSKTPNVLTKEMALELLSSKSNSQIKKYSDAELLQAINQ